MLFTYVKIEMTKNKSSLYEGNCCLFLNVSIHVRCHGLLLKEEAIIQCCYRNCCILLGSKIECRGLTH